MVVSDVQLLQGGTMHMAERGQGGVRHSGTEAAGQGDQPPAPLGDRHQGRIAHIPAGRNLQQPMRVL